VINVNPQKHKVFSMMIRIPGWAVNQVLPSDLYRFKSADQSKVVVKINNSNFKYELKNGYAVISREWKKGDQLLVDLPMPVREVKALEAVKDDAGKVALQRGPLVYCAEWPDNKDGHVLNLYLNRDNSYSTEYLPKLLNGVTIIKSVINCTEPLKNEKLKDSRQSFIAIPYYAWANRGAGEMAVWIPQSPTK
jgi:hypothetical protein